MSLIIFLTFTIVLSSQGLMGLMNYFVDELMVEGNALLYAFPVNKCVMINPYLYVLGGAIRKDNSEWAYYECANDGSAVTKLTYYLSSPLSDSDTSDDPCMGLGTQVNETTYDSNETMHDSCASKHEFMCNGDDKFLEIAAIAGIGAASSCDYFLAYLTVAAEVCVCDPNSAAAAQFTCSDGTGDAAMEIYSNYACPANTGEILNFNRTMCNNVGEVTIDNFGLIRMFAESMECVLKYPTVSPTEYPSVDPTGDPTLMPTTVNYTYAYTTTEYTTTDEDEDKNSAPKMMQVSLQWIFTTLVLSVIAANNA
jgi:hypothetical protein